MTHLPTPTLARPRKPLVVFVTTRERAMLHRHALWLVRKFGNHDHPHFIEKLTWYASRMLPARIGNILRRFARDFGFHQYGAIIFRNVMSIDQQALGRTPQSYHDVAPERVAVYGFISFLLHGGLGAFPIAQVTQRNGLAGGLLHHIIPVDSEAKKAVGQGSEIALWCHTEDASLYSAARFMTLSFLRNYERAASLLHSIRSHDLSKPYIEDLFKRIFLFANDPNGAEEERFLGAVPEAILWGKRWLPFMRNDLQEQLTAAAHQVPAAQQALEEFWRDVQQLLYTEYVPNAGDVIVINNLLVAHGRGSFRAGITLDNGHEVACERRWTCRIMSLDSWFESFPHRDDKHSHLVTERQFSGQLY